jgi:hypothetical protein
MRVKKDRLIDNISTERSLKKFMKQNNKNESHKEILQCKLKVPI